MRSATFAFGLVAGLSVTSAFAQGALPRTGVGASNSINQSFQQQNQIRGIQQQQQLNNNTSQLRATTNQLNAGPRYTGPGTGYVPRRRHARPERER